MGGLWSEPCLLPCRWREAGGGDGSRAAAGGSPGAAQESRGLQREPRGRSNGNGREGPLEVTALRAECSRSCPAEGIQGFQGYSRTSDSAQQPSRWINPQMSHWNWVGYPSQYPTLCSMCPVTASPEKGPASSALQFLLFWAKPPAPVCSALSWTGEPLYPWWSLQAGGTWNCSHEDTLLSPVQQVTKPLKALLSLSKLLSPSGLRAGQPGGMVGGGSHRVFPALFQQWTHSSEIRDRWTREEPQVPRGGTGWCWVRTEGTAGIAAWLFFGGGRILPVILAQNLPS